MTLKALATLALERALVEGEVEGDGELALSLDWFRANRARLLGTYPGEYVAIDGGRLLDHDRDFDALARRVFARLGARPVLMPRVERAGGVRRLRSPRVVRRP